MHLAFSNDNGRTWTRYEYNPVLDLDKQDFRDPKVFWHAPTKRWVMVVSLAVEKALVFYGSDDLKSWTERSRFGPAGVTNKPNWECPDLFELPVEGEPGCKLWVLEVDMGAFPSRAAAAASTSSGRSTALASQRCSALNGSTTAAISTHRSAGITCRSPMGVASGSAGSTTGKPTWFRRQRGGVALAASLRRFGATTLPA
ncbi:MAG: hypothetical protein R3C53_21805 [Pirellulaceae bacterium]